MSLGLLKRLYSFIAASPTLGTFRGLLLVFLLGVMIVAGTSLLLAPLCYLAAGKQRVTNVAKTMRQHAGLTLLTGISLLLGSFLLLFVSSLLGPATPYVGNLFSVLLWVSLVIGYSGISLWVIDTLTPGSNSLGHVLLGAGLITILQVIPLIGPLFLAIFVVLALGGAVLSGLGTGTNWLLKSLPWYKAPPSSPPVAS
jgi:hypothetical protein